MTKARGNCKTTLVNLYYFLIFYTLAIFITSFVLKDLTYSYLLLPLSVPFFLMEWLRFRVRAAAPFFLTHLALVFAVYYAAKFANAPAVYTDGLGDINFYAILCAAMTAIFAIYSIAVRLGKINEVLESKNVIFAAVFATVLFAGAGSIGSEVVRPAILTCFGLIMLAYLLYTHLDAVDRSLEAITMTTTQPVKKILTSTNRLIIIFIAATALLMAAFILFGTDALLTYIGSFLLYLLRKILHYFFADGGGPDTDVRAPAMAEGDMRGLSFYFQNEKQNAFLAFLEKIFAPLAFTILGILAAVLIVYAIYKIIKGFNEKQTKPLPDAKKNFLLPDVVDRVKSNFNWFNFAPVNRVRRVFYKKVVRYMRQGVKIDSSDTAMNIAEKIRPMEDIGELAAEYEKVRYKEG